jgi:transposase
MTEQRPNKINNPQRQEIRRRRAQGELITDLAKAFNVSTLAIRYHTKDIKPKKARYLEEHETEILLMVGQGYSQTAIARHFKVTPGAICKVLARMEWKAAA